MASELVIPYKAEEVARLDARKVIPLVVAQAGPGPKRSSPVFFAPTIRNVNARMACIGAGKKFFA